MSAEQKIGVIYFNQANVGIRASGDMGMRLCLDLPGSEDEARELVHIVTPVEHAEELVKAMQDVIQRSRAAQAKAGQPTVPAVPTGRAN